MVEELRRDGLVEGHRVEDAVLSVPREEFVPGKYRSRAYRRCPFEIPGEEATISAPGTYAIFYEALDLEEGDLFLEVGSGSGYGAALAKEIVGPDGEVTTVELDPETYEFARDNLEPYDVEIVRGDGREGHEEMAPFDAIAVTAAVEEVPKPLLDQLGPGGKLVAPIKEKRGREKPFLPGTRNEGPRRLPARFGRQELVLHEKTGSGVHREGLTDVVYVDLRG